VVLITVAASEGRLEIVQYLVLKGAQLNNVDHMGNTPLYDAVRNKHEDCLNHAECSLNHAECFLNHDECSLNHD
jgi:ankyrin repeat protein